MRIILPTIDDMHPMDNRMEQLGIVEKQLSSDINSGCIDEHFHEIYLSMPKFKLTPDTINIKDKLRSMGMHKAFSDDAEFYAKSNTTPKLEDLSPYLKIDAIYHKLLSK